MFWIVRFTLVDPGRLNLSTSAASWFKALEWHFYQGLDTASGRLKQIANAVAKAIAADKDSQAAVKVPHQKNPSAAVTKIVFEKSEIVAEIIASGFDGEHKPNIALHVVQYLQHAKQEFSLEDIQ